MCLYATKQCLLRICPDDLRAMSLVQAWKTVDDKEELAAYEHCMSH